MPGIGEELREARLARDLTPEYISQIIKIRPEFLTALEEENYQALPGNFYTKNFLRRYADFLELDSTALVERFIRQENEGFARVTETLSSQRESRAPVVSTHRRLNPGILLALLLLLGAGLTLGYNLVSSQAGDDRKANTIPTPSSVPVAAVRTPMETALPEATPTRGGGLVTPLESPTAAATATRAPSQPTATPRATERPAATATAVKEPTSTASPEPTFTPRATSTPVRAPTATLGPTPTEGQPEPTSTAEPAATPTDELPPTSTPAVDGEVVASIRTLTPSRVTVRADGRLVFLGTIQPDDARSFGANANLYVFSRTAPEVLVSVNGCKERSLEKYGCPGCTRAYYNFPRTYNKCN